MMKKRLGNAILLFSSLLVFFGVAECTTRLVWKEDTHGIHQIIPGTLRLMPDTSAVYKSSEFEFRVTSNRFGRRDRQWSESMMKDPKNIVFVGDSFVLGYGVNDAETVPSALERKLDEDGRTTEVFNFGFYGGFHEYKMLTREAIEMGIQAKTVLIGIFLGNDFIDEPLYEIPSRPASAVRLPTLDDSMFYRFMKVRISSSTALTGLLFKMGKLLNRDLYPTTTGYIFLRDWTENQRASFYSYLKQALEIEDVARQNGREVVFVIFPNRVQVENAVDLTSPVYDASAPDHRILDFCRVHSLSCLDLLPILQHTYDQNHQPLFFPVDRHMNPRGNEIAAAAIWEYLQRKHELTAVRH